MGHWTPTGVEPKDYDDDDDEYPERNEVGLSQGIKIIKTKTTKTRNIMTIEQRIYIFMCKIFRRMTVLRRLQEIEKDTGQTDREIRHNRDTERGSLYKKKNILACVYEIMCLCEGDPSLARKDNCAPTIARADNCARDNSEPIIARKIPLI